MMDDLPGTNAVELATELTVAWLSNPNTRANGNDVPDFLRSMHEAIVGLTSPAATNEDSAAAEFQPAVSVRKSLASNDHIISLIDGRSYKTLKRHLANHGLTPSDYRERYGLKSDYPMVAPSYAETRRALAKKIGLGRRAKTPKVEEAAEAATPSPARKRGRPKAS